MIITSKSIFKTTVLLLAYFGISGLTNAQWKISGGSAMPCSEFLQIKTLDNDVAKKFISNYIYGFLDGINATNYYIERERMKVVSLPNSDEEILSYVTQQCLSDPKQTIFRVSIKYSRSMTNQ